MTKVDNPQKQEIGFGSVSVNNNKRFLNSDGTANIRRMGNRKYSFTDLFHELITMKWIKFIALVFSVYTFFNLSFASIYFVLGVEHLGIAHPDSPIEEFLDAFFFSTQCFTTVGFGRISPLNFIANVVASLECLFGLMSLAIITGLLYGRFSRPVASLIKSKNIIVAPFHTGTALMFRIASTREKSLLLENSIAVNLGINELDPEGNVKRKFYGLDLEMNFISSMPMSWTIVHPINEQSPLFGKTLAQIQESSMEFIVFFKAIDETTSQSVYERFSYYNDEIVLGAKFDPMFHYDDDGTVVLDLDKVSDYSWVPSS